MNEIDWKSLAIELAQELLWVVSNIQQATQKGTGLVYNFETGESYHWKTKAADILDKVPGWKVDRELMFAYELPRKEKLKFIAKREKQEAESTNK